tara:strand:- start:54 stop:764 length:711 start_codon:yes stop_codon:yes gene_type:complete
MVCIFILFFLSTLVASFDKCPISMTYNQSYASISDHETNEFFSIQTAYDYNTFNLNDTDLPKSTEIGFWYVLGSFLEFGLQYDGTRLYKSSNKSLQHRSNSATVSFYYRILPRTSFDVSYKIGAFYGQVTIEGIQLSLDNYELREKSTGYGAVAHKKILDLNFFETYTAFDIHYVLNNQHLRDDITASLNPNNRRFFKLGFHLIFDFDRFQLSPYCNWVDGYFLSGASFSLKFKQL